MKRVLLILFMYSGMLNAQESIEDSLRIRAIYDEVLLHGEAYENLRYLCKNIGNRLSGSENAQKAVDWTYDLMNSYEFDKVWKQEIMVPKWERGDLEKCSALQNGKEESLSILSLGSSIGTDGKLSAQVVEVSSLDDLKKRDKSEIEGKIVFISEPMDQTFIRTFHAYGSCAGIRVWGAAEASYKGAVAVINRSLSMVDDDHPHTGVMVYRDTVPKIPAAAISVEGAIRLQEMLTQGKVDLSLEMNCRMLEDVPSYNVIGEITGSDHPEKVMVVGGHLDSWDVGEGAHDDGAGVVQSIEVLRLYKALGVRPKHTVRCVLFMNEENGGRGGKGYAEWAKANENEVPWVAMESDAGGFSPRGFSVKADDIYFRAIQEFSPSFEPYLADLIVKGGGGADINKLEDQGTILIGFMPDSQRYFDLHHSENDVFENVNKRELHLGAATMASLFYLIDQKGLPEKIKE